MAIFPIQNWGLGLNADAMPSELPPGYCTACTGMRFLNGSAEGLGGADPLEPLLNPTVTPYWIGLFASSFSSQGHYHIHAGIAKVFANDFAGASTEITRYTTGSDIASITFVGTTATLTTLTAHGRTTGDAVTVYAALPTDYNFTGAITVTSPTVFTYTMATTPATNATYMGAYSYNVQADFTGAINNRWSGFSLNGVFFLNNPVDGLYYWNGDTTTRLRKAPGSGVYAVARSFKNYVVWIKERSVGWSSATDPGSIPKYWAAGLQVGNDSTAGLAMAATNGVNTDLLPLGDTIWIYARDSRIPMRWTGAADSVFNVGSPTGTDGVRGVSCVVNTPKGHVFLTQNLDVKIHNGGEAVSLAEGRVRTILNTMVVAYRGRAFLCVNPPFNEVWVFFNTAIASGSADVALLWNWNDDTWGNSFGFAGATFAASGLLGSSISQNYMLITTETPRILAQDYASIVASKLFSIERTGITLGDEDTVKNLSRSKWNIESKGGVSGNVTATFQHGSSMFQDDAPTYALTNLYTHGASNWLDGMAKGGRFLALKAIIQSPQNQVIRFKTVYIDATKGGAV